MPLHKGSRSAELTESGQNNCKYNTVSIINRWFEEIGGFCAGRTEGTQAVGADVKATLLLHHWRCLIERQPTATSDQMMKGMMMPIALASLLLHAGVQAQTSAGGAHPSLSAFCTAHRPQSE
eukprot:COSAG02_NODE_13123_length_1443_cov_1.159226_3_plen_122_part_00